MPDYEIDKIYKDIEKDFGDNILISGDEAAKDKLITIPWTPTLDTITGGIEEGSWVGITGNPKTGKTTAALTFAANAQKPEYGSRPVFYDKVEGRLSLHHLQGIKDLDLRKDKFTIIQSTKDKILTMQDRLNILEIIIKSVPNAVIIIDSISAYCDEKENTEGIGTETRGGSAKLFGQFCRLMNQIVPIQKTIVLGITHLISNTSGMGAQYIERAARMWLYQKDYDVKTVMKQAWKAGNKQVGLIITLACNTSKTNPPGMKIESYLRFGVGFDRLYELIQIAIATNLIKKAGAWLTLNYLMKPDNRYSLEDEEEAPKLQGSENVYKMLESKPIWANILYKEVMAISSTLAVGEE